MKKLLVANRGEIAIRVFRACSELGISTVAIYAKEDEYSVHRFKADEAYMVGEGKKPIDAYLDSDDIVRIALESGAEAIHPGYGLLSENIDFARKVEAAGLIFVGPTLHLKSQSASTWRRSERWRSPNLSSTRLTWLFTVSAEITNRAAISRLVYPRQISAATCCSRSERPRQRSRLASATLRWARAKASSSLASSVSERRSTSARSCSERIKATSTEKDSRSDDFR